MLRQETAARKLAPKTVAIFADPVFGKDDVRLIVAKQKDAAKIPRHPRGNRFARAAPAHDEPKALEGPQITRLPFSRREANSILAWASPDKTYVALDFEANRANATSSALLQFRIIHFATHGWLNSDRPELRRGALSG